MGGFVNIILNFVQGFRGVNLEYHQWCKISINTTLYRAHITVADVWCHIFGCYVIRNQLTLPTCEKCFSCCCCQKTQGGSTETKPLELLGKNYPKQFEDFKQQIHVAIAAVSKIISNDQNGGAKIHTQINWFVNCW